ncbi:MAG: Re/Si-specific NAD(P)(+) transhydrogenase subunit alpha [Halobacteriales archaeon]
MEIGVPADRLEGETRVALVPEAAGSLVDRGHDVVVEKEAGLGSDWTDEDYEDAGCTVVEGDRAFEADVVLQVNGLGATDALSPDTYAEGQVAVGMQAPYEIEDEEMQALARRDVTAFALELMPRISRAQSMDALSSMASVGGYKAAVLAAERLPKLYPMQMTAAGTVRPAEVFVVGAGVAGLQAIATAERLGASVRAYDIRPEVAEEVESLGAEFVELDLDTDDASEGGHAKHQDEEFYRRQREMMTRVVADSDVVITTAAVPGGPAPELVTSEMIDGMDPGSVIVDLAAAGGGNCEPTEADEVVTYADVEVHGPTNLPATVPHTASELYSNNMTSFLDHVTEGDEIEIDLDDEITTSTLLTYEGEARMPHKRDASGDAGEDGGDEEGE